MSHLSVTRILSAVLLLDIALIALVAFTGTSVDAMLAGFLPGKFGPGMGPNMTGNHLLGALIVFGDALLFLLAGFLALLGTMRDALMIGAGGFARLLRGTAGLSQEDIAAASFAVAEEQKSEIRRVDTGRNLVWIGALLLLLAFPAVCFTYAQADSKGQPLLQDAGGTVANTALSIEDSVVFAADQLADAVLLDAPRVFQWHLTSLTPGHNHRWLRPFVLLYHILSKLVVLASLFAAWRGGHLRAYVLQMAGLDVAVPMLLGGKPQEAPAAAPEHHVTVAEYLPAEEAPLPPQTVEYQPHENPPEPSLPIPLEPNHADHAHQPVEHTPEPEQDKHEEPLALEAPILEVPVYTEPAHPEHAAEHPLSDSPLALHELKTPEDGTPMAANDGEPGADDAVHHLPYKNTALHLDAHEFDA